MLVNIHVYFSSSCLILVFFDLYQSFAEELPLRTERFPKL